MSRIIRKSYAIGFISLAVWSFGSTAFVLKQLYAQDGAVTPPSKVERKNRAPVSREILQVKLPKPVETKLKNGLTVLIIEDRRAPFVSMQLYIGGAGALFEPAGMAGLANSTAQMLREGTRTRTSIQLAEEIDRLGASISAGAAFGSSDVVLTASEIGRASCRERV